MASYTKRGKTWRASVKKQGIRKTATFDSKAEAVAWTTRLEAEIMAGKRGQLPDNNFSDLLERYAREVSPKKRGEKWEAIRINAFMQMAIAGVSVSELDASHFAQWRDTRLKTVSSATVNREWNLLSNVCTTAVNEWKWLNDNPMKTVKRPAPSKSRDRLIAAKEVERLLFALGYDNNTSPKTLSAKVGSAFLFAMETAMRAGEIVSLSWDKLDLKKRVARLTETKNGSNRDVPLSSEAIRILEQLPRTESNSVFGLNSANMDALFRKAKSRALIEDLHFHDTRHEAITRLAKKLDVLELARMVGHRDLKMLMVYYNETAEQLAKKLD